MSFPALWHQVEDASCSPVSTSRDFPPKRLPSAVRTFQLAQLFDNLTVLENVKVGRHLHTTGGLLTALVPLRAARSEMLVEDASRALLQQVGLASQTDVLAGVLPYGQ